MLSKCFLARGRALFLTSFRNYASPTNFYRIDENQLSLFNIYYKLHGNLLIKQQFVVPDTAPWPKWGHGYRLGAFVNQIRQYKKKNKLHPNTQLELEKIGFIWDVLLHKYDNILTAFRTYKNVYGHINVPMSFIVPSDDEAWPKATWNLKLGLVGLNARNYDDSYKPIKPMLEELGFDFSKQRRDFDRVKAALTVYKEIHNDLIVPQPFLVPCDDPRYPEHTWGLTLGEIVNHIRNHDNYEDYREELLAMGFEFDPMKARFQRYFRALQRYQTVFGHLNIPLRYIIPKGSIEFDEECWDMRLGLVCWNMRNLGYFAEFADQLKPLGIIVVSQPLFCTSFYVVYM